MILFKINRIILIHTINSCLFSSMDHENYAAFMHVRASFSVLPQTFHGLQWPYFSFILNNYHLICTVCDMWYSSTKPLLHSLHRGIRPASIIKLLIKLYFILKWFSNHPICYCDKKGAPISEAALKWHRLIIHLMIAKTLRAPTSHQWWPVKDHSNMPRKKTHGFETRVIHLCI